MEIKLWQSTDKPIEKYLINAASISDRKNGEESIQTARKLIANTDFFVDRGENGRMIDLKEDLRKCYSYKR